MLVESHRGHGRCSCSGGGGPWLLLTLTIRRFSPQSDGISVVFSCCFLQPLMVVDVAVFEEEGERFFNFLTR